MDVGLVPVAFEDRSVVANLMQLCQHDYAEFDGDEVDRHGLYGYRWLDHYWTEVDRFPFLIRVDGWVAGFALVRDLPDLGDGDIPHSIAEFFVLRKYRGRGVGRRAAGLLFGHLPPGRWLVGQSLTNLPAQAFWRSVIGEFTDGRFREHRDGTRNIIEFVTGGDTAEAPGPPRPT